MAENFDNLNKELENINMQQAPVAEKKKASAKLKKKASVKIKAVIATSKRKRAVARARLIKGRGILTINSRQINTVMPIEIRDLIMEPIKFSNATENVFKDSNINVNVYGGGVSAQANAIRTSIAKVISKASGNESIFAEYMKFDRNLLVDDIRQVETKKFLGTKARARFQKSYR
jgi:small subunit ribosomal protein S9